MKTKTFLFTIALFFSFGVFAQDSSMNKNSGMKMHHPKSKTMSNGSMSDNSMSSDTTGHGMMHHKMSSTHKKSMKSTSPTAATDSSALR